MDKDRLINLLPEEYLPEPEFKAFPIFAALVLILTVVFIVLQFIGDDRMVRRAKREFNTIEQRNMGYLADANQFLEVQANARFLRSYIAVIPNMVLQAPDYWEIYNELEESLPEDTWVENFTFRGGRGKWPDVSASFLSRGYGFSGPLLTYDRLLGSLEHPSRFRNLRMNGYHRVFQNNAAAAKYDIYMEVKFPLGEDLPE